MVQIRTKIIHEEESPLLYNKDKEFFQQVVGSFLYCAQAEDYNILMAHKAITTEQVKPTECIMTKVHHFLDYMATQPDTIIQFHGRCHSGCFFPIGGHRFRLPEWV